MSEWIGVDLDGTLAHYEKWMGKEHIGWPVPLMLEQVKKWRVSGYTVKIFTARASDPDNIPFIRTWLKAHGLGELEITNVKDFGCIALYDDRAYRVEKNTGRIL